MGMRLGLRSNGWTRGWAWRPQDSKVDSPNKWVSYPPRRPLSDIIRLLAFLMVALARSTVLMALLAYKPAKEHQDERQTDKRRRRDKGLGAKETAAKRRKKTGRRRIILPTRTRGLRGAKEKGTEGEKDRRHHARGRGGVWSNLLRGLVSPGFIFHKLFTEPRAHTQDKDSSASHSFVSIGPHPVEARWFLTTYRRS